MAKTTAGTADLEALKRLFGLEGKVAMVTDNGGEGHAPVLTALAQAGATVISADLSPTSSERAMAEAPAAKGQITYIPCDVASQASIKACFDAVRSRFGRVDILVNAGALYANAPLADVTDEQWRNLQAVNLDANFLCMREAIRLMLAIGQGGRIINLTTIGAVRPVMHGNTAYGAARAGVTMLGRTAAYDYAAQGIRVNTILCGSVPNHVRYDEEAANRPTGKARIPEERIPLGRGEMKDVAAAVLYLAGPASAWITGQELVVDGGYFVS